jgi:cysteine-rich repeat protein
MRERTWFGLVVLLLGVVAACGDNIKVTGTPDAPPVLMQCGNLVVEGTEECDDGNEDPDMVCTADCHFTCGNGAVDTEFGETCDLGIGSGAGACPATCDDGDACTGDVTSGSECTTACINSPITVPVDDDGCCPPGADATSDNDCSSVCGNGVLEVPDETCDTAIGSGPGSCPIACDDLMSCTTDALTNPATCQAACTATPITTPIDDDGCCPPGADSTTDNDCPPGCGNGIFEPGAGETCDTGIPTGAGSCPTACNDSMACTTDVLANPGTCTAACVFTAITMPIDGDSCCPPGANANNDDDCAPVCLNGVVEPGEQCDDGNMNNTDGCTNACTLPPTAFRFSDLDLRDPHVYIDFLGCQDVTDTPLAGFSVNGELQTNIQTDDDADGQLDLSPVLVFRPFTQMTGASTALEVHFAECTAPMSSTTCGPGSDPPVDATATNQGAGTCLQPITGTTYGPYTPDITNTSAPCFVSTNATVSLDLAGTTITLRDAQVAATYVGNPAMTMTNGLLRGFITEADADATVVAVPLLGDMPLSRLLPGGTGSCSTHDDRDTNMGMSGWWFYLNFPAGRVPWTD